ncbi:MAG: polysaccharide deacetylase family protein [Actinobacteria bacterium]|nr:polysaccharide deacetylase family protein [Cyanobacteriota bacterium]MCL5771477.1 polysaccharide deacetylase family protein [Actinomycetota bacterium]
MKNEKPVLKNVFLTFDDGPNEPCTSQILDILKKFHARASFFVCGKNAQYYPQIIRKIVKEGHIIANHTYSHSRFLTYTGLLHDEIEKTQKIIQEISGKNSDYFRPPWGITAPRVKRYIKIHNYKLILWDIDSYDWKNISEKIIVNRILEKVKPNSIILFHDGKGTFHKSDRFKTVNALSVIIENLKKDGYKFEGIDKFNC